MKASGKKTALVRKEMPGFIVNRVMGAITREIALHPRRGHLHPRGPEYRHQVQHRFPLRLPGPHGSGRHDRPRHLRDGVGPGVPGPEQRDRAVAGWSSRRSRRANSGIKSGKGWYDYSGKTREEVLEEKNRALLPQLKLFMARELAKQASSSRRKEVRCSI